LIPKLGSGFINIAVKVNGEAETVAWRRDQR
jgi:hypothetical protein